ncbi:integrase core domain-containing protein [Actinacidiphila glaucinigra]|uniref:integrase core domain-containing protein n=1 Tax=Actinacidiphila glaucinigra TaxID=235986 RepID=UPI0033A77CD6
MISAALSPTCTKNGPVSHTVVTERHVAEGRRHGTPPQLGGDVTAFGATFLNAASERLRQSTSRADQWFCSVYPTSLGVTTECETEPFNGQTPIGLFKTEVLKPQRPWRSLAQVELAIAEWTDWYNLTRLHREIGHIPPAEYEANHYLNATKTQVTTNN